MGAKKQKDPAYKVWFEECSRQRKCPSCGNFVWVGEHKHALLADGSPHHPQCPRLHEATP